jgi:phosphomannomutase/phosphoglucomutase
MGIFRSYDIRGIYPNELNEEIAFKIGAAFGTYINGKIVVGCDSRLSSPSLKKALIKGLLSTGSNVIDIGLTTTPIVMFSTRYLNCNGAVMVSASHNPKNYNGFKLYGKNGLPIGMGYGMEKVQEIFEKESFLKGKGKVEKKSIFKEYSNFLISHVKINKPLKMKVVVDCGNGSPGKIYPKILKKIGIEVYELYCEPDGNFPNHEPDPSKEDNLKDLRKKVLEIGADLGFAYDGDGDRVIVINKEGSIVYVGVVFSILIRSSLEKYPGGKVIYTVVDSRAIEETIKKNGGIPVVCRVGHTHISQKMFKEDAVLAGEISGHYYFKETLGSDDALFATLKLIEYLMNSGKNISYFDKELPRYYSEISEKSRYPIKESEKFSFIEKLKKEFEEKGYKIDTTDGVKVIFDDGWLLIRPSHTEAVVAIVYEAINKEAFEKIKKLADEIIKRIPR